MPATSSNIWYCRWCALWSTRCNRGCCSRRQTTGRKLAGWRSQHRQKQPDWVVQRIEITPVCHLWGYYHWLQNSWDWNGQTRLVLPFKGKENHHRWTTAYGATVICPSKRNALRPWPKSLRRWVASIRQIVETVNHKLANTFRLDRKRPHCISGVRTQIAAKVALHNFCIWLNWSLSRPNLAFADLLGRSFSSAWYLG